MTLALELYIILKLFLGAPVNTLISTEQGLPPWYAPGLNPAAVEALDHMSQAAEQDGIRIWVYSDYRDFVYQQSINLREGDHQPYRYRSYTGAPGHSEHQLGTAFDLAWPGLPLESLDPRNLELFAWLEQNAHKFGFVVSYPYKETDEWPYHNRWMPQVTEYIYEPWHIRFASESLAQEMWDAGYLDPRSPVLPQDFYLPWP